MEECAKLSSSFFPARPFFDFLPLPPHPSVSHMREKNPPLFCLGHQHNPIPHPHQGRGNPRDERGAGEGFFPSVNSGNGFFGEARFFRIFRAKFTWFLEAERGKKPVKKYSCNFLPASCSRTKPPLFLGKVSMMEMGAKGDLQMSSQPPTSPKKNPLVFSRLRYGKGKKNRGEK